MSNILTLLIVIFLVSGCATGAGSRVPTTNYTNDGSTVPLADKKLGSVVSIDGIDFTISKEYFAASGKECKELRHSDGSFRVACNSPRGEWYLRAPLYPEAAITSTTATPIAVPLPMNPESTSIVAVPLEPSSSKNVESAISQANQTDPVIQLDSEVDNDDFIGSTDSVVDGEPVALQAGETLWKFSRRVTGNALNWERIAQVNALEDVKSLKAGDYLIVPVDLLITDPNR